MLTLFALITVIFTISLGLILSVTALYFGGRKKPKLGKNNLACFLGILSGIFIWIVLIASIPIGGTSANNMDGFPAALLSIFLIGATPIAALPALMLFGPGKQ